MNIDDDAVVAGHATEGKIDDLTKAARQHRTADEDAHEGHAPAVPDTPSDEPVADEATAADEGGVTGSPTLGSIRELRFAHHAHHPDEPAEETPGD